MPRTTKTLALCCLAAAPLAAPLAAQDLRGCDPAGESPAFLSAENDVHYGCGYLFRSRPAQYPQAESYFRSALAKRPDDAVVLYLLAASLAGQARASAADSARALAARALAADANVERALAPRFAEAPEVRRALDVAMGRARPAPVAEAPPTPAAPPTTPTTPPPAAPGLPVRKDAPAPPATPAAPVPAAPRAGGPLAHGDYACTHARWEGLPPNGRRVWDPKGVITVRANGTYRYLANGGTGRYRYDPATGALTWLTGPLATMRPERTTFQRDASTAQLDLQLKGDYHWSCGKNLP